jgi:hypothetical protein
METLDVVYFTCLNNQCPKHRNVFREGDPEHERCARQRLWLEGQRPAVPRWVWLLIPALAAAVIGATLAALRMRTPEQREPMLHGEAETKTWSGAHAHRDDREGNPVPPPIA